MKNTYRIISLLLVLLLFSPSFSVCEEPDALVSELEAFEEIITSYLNDGLTIKDIADLMDEEEAASGAPSALTIYGPNYLLLTHEIIVREIVLRGIPIDCTTIIQGMSYDELVSLNKQINLAIMQSDEWREITVPIGEYIVGEDIPAGTYTVTTGESYCSLEIHSNGKKVHDFDSFGPEVIGKLALTDGQVVLVEYDYVVFKPYVGLGF